MKPAVFAALAVLLIVFLAVAKGCSTADWIEVPVPPDVQKAIGAPPKVPLSLADDLIGRFNDHVARQSTEKQAELAAFQRRAGRAIDELSDQLTAEARTLELDMESFRKDTERAGLAFASRIDRARQTADMIGAAINDGLTAANPSGVLSAVPGGAILTGLLGGLAGLFIKSPGTQKKIDESYDLGRKDALNDVKAVKA